MVTIIDVVDKKKKKPEDETPETTEVPEVKTPLPQNPTVQVGDVIATSAQEEQQLLKEQRRSESPSNLADTIRRYLSEELYKPKGTYGK